MKKTENSKSYHKLFYLAATLFFIASTIAAISGKPSGTALSIGSLFLVLGVIYSEKSRDNKDKE